MKLFIYKFLLVLVGAYILFQLTIGILFKQIEGTIVEYSSGDNILFLKEKIRKEIKNNLNKDKILNEEDALLLRDFLNKIQKEIFKSN